MEKKNELVKMSFFKGLKLSFDDVFDHLCSFMFISITCAFFSILLKDVLMMLGNASSLIFIAYVVFFLLIVSFFINSWFLILSKKCKITDILKSQSFNDVLRTLFFVFSNLLAWGIIVGVSMFLYKRVVTLGFWLEILLYFVLSFIVILSFLYLLNNVVFIRFLNKEKWWVFRKHFWFLYDNINKIIGWVFVLFIMFFTLTRELSSLVYFSDFCVSVVYMWVFYFCLALYISILNYQYKKIFIREY